VSDIALTWDPTHAAADLAVVANDLAREDGLKAAVLLSLFLDRRAEDGDNVPAPASSGAGPAYVTAGFKRVKRATNRFLRSQEFDNAAWTKNKASVTPNAVAAPDGTLTADKIVEDNTDGVHFVRQNITLADDTTYTLSVYAKAAGRSAFEFAPRDKAGDGKYANFDLLTGTVTSSTGGTARVEAVGNGWYRLIWTYNSGTGATQAPLLEMFIGNAPLSYTYLGDGVSGVYLWGAQHESGSEATAYIPTAASAVTVIDSVPILKQVAASTSAPDRRGWWADAEPVVERDRIGSRLWLLAREKDTAKVRARAEEYAREALQWLVEDRVAERVEVSADGSRPGWLVLAVTIYRPQADPAKYRFTHTWAAQEA
jgi:phage gp46-like protein